MKMVLNKAYGGFRLPEDFYRDSEWDMWGTSIFGPLNNISRRDESLISFLENHPDKAGDLVVVKLPEDMTDWEINQYDGLEYIIYVVDGKIRHA